MCVQQLGELQRSGAVLDALRKEADLYVLNRDDPEASRRLKAMSGISVPVLLDGELTVARAYDFLPKPGQPMGGMAGVAQMGFVMWTARGVSECSARTSTSAATPGRCSRLCAVWRRSRDE